ncbi:hypothetical protein, variant 1 [Aphanomyces astaci]|uniref:Tubulin-tyrosine ligase n=1 Tax=Aphanomyces astaci TaxID=112090 RepID=W4H512_APHAT|nr:hypothetical protein, variant 1 [Aphanomyces astaci]ETV87070.1 hypothetical protein, variant 1 [Aphanomyces astaci]|eukprot:XP_009823870.1 hypothetical protein, variant 1 [Aphanomyces astaci]
MTKTPGYVVDDKFPDVIEYLDKAGWTACPHHTYPNCMLRYTNYVKIQWSYVKPHQVINHLQHAILLSKKHELLRHLEIRQGVYEFLPRSTTTVDAWFPMFVYAQALLVLKNPSTYAANLPAARCIAHEIRRLNDPSRRKHGLILMYESFVTSHADTIATLISATRTPFEPVPPHAPDDDALLTHLEACDPQFHFVSTRNLWIAKPTGLSQGRGIQILSTPKQVQAYMADAQLKAVVLQQYVERPLLVLGRKFDIRQWVLVTATAPLTIYWHRHCYLRFSSKPYSVTHDGDLDDKFIHLCNNSIQKTAPNAGNDHPDIPQHMWSLDRFLLHLSQVGGRDRWDSATLPAMQHAAIEAILSVQSNLTRVGRGFEWLGLDFILDERLHPWLLEVNVSPDVSHSTSTTADLVPQATRDLLDCTYQQHDNLISHPHVWCCPRTK